MTIPNQWYYVKNNERCGPVEPAQLKQLADAGEIQRDSLVWRVGMANWVEAEQVQGLFTPPVQPGAPSIQEPPVAAAPPTSPVVQQPQPPQPQAPQPVPATPGPADMGQMPPVEDPAQMIQPELRTKVRARRKGFDVYHPTPILLDWLRMTSSPRYVKSSIRFFTQIGYWGVFAYVGLLLIGSLIGAIQTREFRWFGIAIGISVGLVLLQHVSVKMLEFLGRWELSLPVPRAVFDMVAVLALLVGLGSLGFLVFWGLSIKVYSLLVVAIFPFVLFAHFGKVALSLPTWEDVPENQGDRTLAGEAVAVFGGLLLVTLRTVPVLFAIGIFVASLQLLDLLIGLGNPSGSLFFTMNSWVTAEGVLSCLLLPFVVYLIALLLRVFGKLIIVLLRGIPAIQTSVERKL
ncbi:MAG: DUF4339 domain-containing protein [Planctomycetia bacterium]|jgi:hypothetical protein